MFLSLGRHTVDVAIEMEVQNDEPGWQRDKTDWFVRAKFGVLGKVRVAAAKLRLALLIEVQNALDVGLRFRKRRQAPVAGDGSRTGVVRGEGFDDIAVVL